MTKENEVATGENIEQETENTSQIENSKPTEEELEDLFDSYVTPTEEAAAPQEDFEDEPAPEPAAEKDEKEEKNEGPSEEDLKKEQQVNAQIEKGKNYIDQELINSIEDKELRQKVWSLANTANSHHGRFLQSMEENRKLKAELDQMRRERESQPNPTSQAQKQQQDQEWEAKIKKLKNDYPDLYEEIGAFAHSIFDKKSQEFEELIDSKYGQMRQQYMEESRQRELQRLDEAAQKIFHTDETGIDYRAVVASEDFAAWLSSQPEHVQKMQESDSAADAIRLLEFYNYDYSREYQSRYGRNWIDDVKSQRSPTEETPTSANTLNDPTAQNGANRADEIAAQREQKKRTSVTGVRPSRSAATSGASIDDPDALFDHYASKSNRR